MREDSRVDYFLIGVKPASTAAIADPEECALAEGLGRRERRGRADLDLAALMMLALTRAAIKAESIAAR